MKPNVQDAKKLLVVIDLVNGFVREGAMADKHIEHILPESERLVKKFIEEGNAVVYVKEWHDENAEEFKKFPKHCVEGTSEAEMVDELLKYQDNVLVFKKNSTSAMAPKCGLVATLGIMENLHEVVIIGCCTDICVLNCAIPMQNYFDEENRKVSIVVPKNVVETYDAPNHLRKEYNEIAFKLMSQAGIKVVNNY